MKFFIDTANVDEIKQAQAWGILDGVTTNPSLIAREGIEHKKRVMEIISVVGDIPVSAECVETDVDKLMKEARDIASWAPNIYVKVPMNANSMEVVKELSPQGINFNVTLIFSLPQARHFIREDTCHPRAPFDYSVEVLSEALVPPCWWCAASDDAALETQAPPSFRAGSLPARPPVSEPPGCAFALFALIV